MFWLLPTTGYSASTQGGSDWMREVVGLLPSWGRGLEEHRVSVSAGKVPLSSRLPSRDQSTLDTGPVGTCRQHSGRLGIPAQHGF